MNQLLFLSLLVFGTLVSGQILGPCCFQKKVGGISYTLVNEDTNTDEYGCQSNCVYQNDDIVGSRYCFAKGGQEVKCLKEVSHLERTIDDFAICGQDLEEFAQILAESGYTHNFTYCNGTAGNCTGNPCNTIFGNFTCVRPVTDIEDLSKCKSEIRPLIDALMATATQANCEMYQKKSKQSGCPQSADDPRCNCCKYPMFTTPDKCQLECRCKGACDWFGLYGHCIPYTSPCCLCKSSKYKTRCASTCSVTSVEPGPAEPAELADPKVCADCNTEENAETKFCKCKCLCNQAMKMTGNNCPPPWNSCHMDYAFCCDCDEDYIDYNYKHVCPKICTLLKKDDEGKPASLYNPAKLPAPDKNNNDCKYP